MKSSLLVKYFEIKKLPTDIRYQELKKWERQALEYIENRKASVTQLFVVNHR